MRIVIGEGSCGIAAGARKVRNAPESLRPGRAEIGVTGCIEMETSGRATVNLI